MTNQEGNCCKQPLKAPEVKQEATASIADAKEISVKAAVAPVLSELDGNVTLKIEQRMALKVVFRGKDVTSLQAGFGKSLPKHHSTSRLATGS